MTREKFDRDDSETRVSVFMPWGFHGDPHIMQVVDRIAPRVLSFIETGTEAGSTVAYMARMYPHITCHTTEADPGTHVLAKANTANHNNIRHNNQLSQDWLPDLPADPALFWLDAHSHGWGCSLADELEIILDRWPGGYVLMDDFGVPGDERFGYDWYHSFGKLNWETLDAALPETLKVRIRQLFYPNYPPDYFSRGWALLVFGDALYFELQDDLREP